MTPLRYGRDAGASEGCLIPDVIDVAKNNAPNNPAASFNRVTSMEEAFKMRISCIRNHRHALQSHMEQRAELLRDHDGQKPPEQRCLAPDANHKDWHCTEEMMKLTKDGEALYMRTVCLRISPVFPVRKEVEEAVFEKYRIATYKASWKPYIISAMILARKFPQPALVLEQLLKNARKRIL